MSNSNSVHHVSSSPRACSRHKTSVSLKLPSREPNEGQVLLRTLYLSVDPHMRQVMNEVGPKYAPSVRLGEPMVGEKTVLAHCSISASPAYDWKRAPRTSNLAAARMAHVKFSSSVARTTTAAGDARSSAANADALYRSFNCAPTA